MTSPTARPRGVPRLRAAALAGLLALAGATAATAASAAGTQTFEIGLTNIQSVGEEGDTANTTLSFDLGSHATVVGFSWDVDVTAFDPSWLSELTLSVANIRGEGFYFSPALDDDESGTLASSGSVDLLDSGLAFSTRANGRLYLEFFEFYDDLADAADGHWSSAQFSVVYAPIPEPATMALFAAGLLGVAVRRQRARSHPA